MIDPAEIERIAASIHKSGYCLLKEEKLRRILQDGDSPSARFQLLANLALQRRWSFEFRPHDGEVRIAALPLIQMEGNGGVGSRQKTSSNKKWKKYRLGLRRSSNQRESRAVTPQVAELPIPGTERLERTDKT